MKREAKSESEAQVQDCRAADWSAGCELARDSASPIQIKSEERTVESGRPVSSSCQQTKEKAATLQKSVVEGISRNE